MCISIWKHNTQVLLIGNWRSLHRAALKFLCKAMAWTWERYCPEWWYAHSQTHRDIAFVRSGYLQWNTWVHWLTLFFHCIKVIWNMGFDWANHLDMLLSSSLWMLSGFLKIQFFRRSLGNDQHISTGYRCMQISEPARGAILILLSRKTGLRYKSADVSRHEWTESMLNCWTKAAVWC